MARNVQVGEYVSPTVEMMEICVEHGFATSPEYPDYPGDEENELFPKTYAW